MKDILNVRLLCSHAALQVATWDLPFMNEVHLIHIFLSLLRVWFEWQNNCYKTAINKAALCTGGFPRT